MILEIVKLAYEHPGITLLFLFGLAIITAEFRPIAIVKYEPKKDTEEKECR